MLNIKSFTVNPLGENTYLLWDETKKAAIVDCGAFFEEEKSVIDEFISENNLQVERLLLTHAHFDHIFGAQHIYSNYSICPEVSKDDVLTYSIAKEQMLLFMHREIPLDLPPLKGTFSEDDILKFGKSSLQVIAMPGHTPGGVCFYDASNGILLSGDSLFRGSIGRTDLPGSSHETLIKSLSEKIMTLPENTRVLPGHGGETTIAYEKMYNPYL